MRLIRREECITSKANWKSGGPIQRRKGFKGSRIASSSNILVFLISKGCHCALTRWVAYTIDDGKGGEIHVNVSLLYLEIFRLTGSCFTGKSVRFPESKRIICILTFFVRTSGENIGDTGLIQAYRAWKAQYEISLKDGNEFLLPGLDHYTRDQLFFIAFGRIWARNMRPAAAVRPKVTELKLADDWLVDPAHSD